MNTFIKTLGVTAFTVGLMAASTVTAYAADYTIRATANSNENDEDYDGLVVFKNFVEAASNGEIAVELFQPFLLYEMLDNDFADTIKSAKKFIRQNKIIVQDILKKRFLTIYD